MSRSWADVCKVANGDKRNGVNLSDLSRLDKTLASIKIEIDKVATLAAKARLARETKMFDDEKKANPLFVLPWEVRRLVLDLAIDPIHSPLFLEKRKTGAISKFPIPALARAFTNRNRLECLLVLLEKSTLEIHSISGLTKTMAVLQSIDFNDVPRKDTSYNLGFDCIRTLSFSYFSRFPHAALGDKAINKDVMLMRMCKNLRSVRIVFVDDEVTFRTGNTYVAKSIERIRREYRLDAMLGLKNLRVLDLLDRGTIRVSDEAGDIGWRQVSALKGWFEGEFAKLGREVVVNVARQW